MKEILFYLKVVFLKVENLQKLFVLVELGIEMVVQFGGDCYYLDGMVLCILDSWKDFFCIFFLSNGDSGVLESDQINILGNYVGSYSVVVGYYFLIWKIKVYWEYFFEDCLGMILIYGMWRDCLVGLEVMLLENFFVKMIVGEFLYMKY